MFDFLKKKDSQDFTPNKSMLEAAIIKGQKIGLSTEEIIEMASLMDKGRPRSKIVRLVEKTLNIDIA